MWLLTTQSVLESCLVAIPLLHVPPFFSPICLSAHLSFPSLLFLLHSPLLLLLPSYLLFSSVPFFSPPPSRYPFFPSLPFSAFFLLYLYLPLFFPPPLSLYVKSNTYLVGDNYLLTHSFTSWLAVKMEVMVTATSQPPRPEGRCLL